MPFNLSKIIFNLPATHQFCSGGPLIFIVTVHYHSLSYKKVFQAVAVCSRQAAVCCTFCSQVLLFIIFLIWLFVINFCPFMEKQDSKKFEYPFHLGSSLFLTGWQWLWIMQLLSCMWQIGFIWPQNQTHIQY